MTIEVDRDVGSLRYFLNGNDEGIAYTDERIKIIPLHFAVSMRFQGQEVQILIQFVNSLDEVH